MTEDEAVDLIQPGLTRDETGNEVENAVSWIYAKARLGDPLAGASAVAGISLKQIAFDAAKLEAAAARISQPPKNWRHWLWERSPVRPESQNPVSFLAKLYADGERVLVFHRMNARQPDYVVEITVPMDSQVPAALLAGGSNGTWFLSNPVDGLWYLNPRTRKRSCRSEESVTSFRYAVLEGDKAPAHLWLALLVQLPMRVAAIYTSGGRSIHCLIRVDAQSKAEWDAKIEPLKRPLKAVGADPDAMTAVRLTRLPGCWRPEKRGFQKLLYLCPNPPVARLLDLPVVETRKGALARWRPYQNEIKQDAREKKTEFVGFEIE